MTLGWRRPVVFLHRWLGVALCLLFLAWFVSGLVMIYARMPELSPAERLARLAPIDVSTARVRPEDAAPPGTSSLRIAMLAGRPVYRFSPSGTIVFADTGDRFAGFSAGDALAESRRFAPEAAATAVYEQRIDAPDQWTLEHRADLPLHRVALGDSGDTVLYLSDRTGEFVMKTTARERRWAYVGAITHWLYITPLRRHPGVWAQTIIWTSLAGSALCILGLVWGISVWRSPYAGWMRWHHVAGLVFGATTFSWVFSGLLSMDPWDWHPSTSPTAAQRAAFSGGPLKLDGVGLDAVAAIAGAKEVEIQSFRGEPRLIVDGARSPSGPVDDEAIREAAREAVPGAPMIDAVQLDRYDAYYYDRAGRLALPIVRVRFGDRAGTWLYVDPVRGAIVRKEERLSRLNRWLYHGFHSFDFPFLYGKRPLWDAVLIVLSVGGLLSSVTSLIPAWRRLRRHAHRLYSGRHTQEVSGDASWRS